jgi:hypothetical protein
VLRRFRGLRRWVRVALVAGLALVILALGGYVALAIRGADTPPPASLGEAPEDGLAADEATKFEGRCARQRSMLSATSSTGPA